MALAYTAPTWTDGSGEGISASNLQAISDCIEGLVQGSDKAIHSIAINGSALTVVYADGTQDTFTAVNLKGIVSITKTNTTLNVDTYTILYTDGTTDTFTVRNGEDAPNNGVLTLKQNGTTKQTFSANQNTDVEADFITDEWFDTVSPVTVSGGAFTFSGLDDTQGWGFEPWVDVDDNSTNKNPSCEITSITGAGTSNMSVTYSTDADENATVHMRIIK